MLSLAFFFRLCIMTSGDQRETQRAMHRKCTENTDYLHAIISSIPCQTQASKFCD